MGVVVVGVAVFSDTCHCFDMLVAETLFLIRSLFLIRNALDKSFSICAVPYLLCNMT